VPAQLRAATGVDPCSRSASTQLVTNGPPVNGPLARCGRLRPWRSIADMRKTSAPTLSASTRASCSTPSWRAKGLEVRMLQCHILPHDVGLDGLFGMVRQQWLPSSVP
jgi:hypothetical protein